MILVENIHNGETFVVKVCCFHPIVVGCGPREGGTPENFGQGCATKVLEP